MDRWGGAARVEHRPKLVELLVSLARGPQQPLDVCTLSSDLSKALGCHRECCAHAGDRLQPGHLRRALLWAHLCLAAVDRPAATSRGCLPHPPLLRALASQNKMVRKQSAQASTGPEQAGSPAAAAPGSQRRMQHTAPAAAAPASDEAALPTSSRSWPPQYAPQGVLCLLAVCSMMLLAPCVAHRCCPLVPSAC